MSLLRPVDAWLEAYRRARTSSAGRSLLRRGTAVSEELSSASAATDGFGAFRALADRLPDAVLYVDSFRICRAHNRIIERLLGIESIDIDMMPLRELMGSTSYLCIEDFVEQALRGDEVWLRQVHPRVDGTLCAFNAHYVPHQGEDGTVRGFIALLTPVASHPEQISFDGDNPEHHEVPSGDSAEPLNPSEESARGNESRRRIAQAIQSRQFRLYRQEIVHLNDCGASARTWEVLLRMKDSAQRLIHPAAFLGIAESTGSLVELDRWVVNHLSQIVSIEPDDATSSFHINLCHDSLLNNGFAHRLRQLFERGPLVPRCMNFEINESDLARSRMNVMACAHALRMLGCRVGLDRFSGDTGMVAALIDLPIDFVKIDGSLIDSVKTSQRARTRVQVIAKLSRSTGIRTIAERVESTEVLEVVRTLGVDAVQGYGVAMPEPFG